MTIERRVTAGRVEADVVSRNLREDSLRGCLNRSRAGEFRQARLVCKGVQPLKLNSIAARGYVEGFSLCVISAVSDDVASIQICIDTIKLHGCAGERCMRSEALQWLTANPARPKSEIGDAAHRVRHARDFQSARDIRVRVGELIAPIFLR